MNQQRRQFYTNAFRSANPNASGSISARNAVHLLRKSMLPKDVRFFFLVNFRDDDQRLRTQTLRSIWSLSVPNGAKDMNMQSFYVALNLVAFAQSNPGRTLSVDALTPEVLNGLPIPKLSGFGASPKMAAASSSNGISNIGSDLVQLPKQSVSPWIISRSDRVKYEQFFFRQRY